jgi:hypothetical protein
MELEGEEVEEIKRAIQGWAFVKFTQRSFLMRNFVFVYQKIFHITWISTKNSFLLLIPYELFMSLKNISFCGNNSFFPYLLSVFFHSFLLSLAHLTQMTTNGDERQFRPENVHSENDEDFLYKNKFHFIFYLEILTCAVSLAKA